MTENFPLPIGSVITLENTDRPVMIYGRLQSAGEGEVLFDYIGCFYPGGQIDGNNTIYFQHHKINSLLHKGYVSEEEEELHKKLAEKNSEFPE
ncbi:DUF4176 domain-containing protein [Fictibacillus sp. KIGAM418]|uniref:DUF4176 domain-containing protein n=1 Tax=Fictibacillus marinisediminis TaxID=2878389 RepID=A0A9X1XE70_9BACL|nr:DUF4176 domain-containing protein [Fictibacillus marinisediminis]MCK6259056.1 DUF4176 domain-containing protein [Fictibacillus marinisediminis]